jgi:hypothetical protein
MKKSTTFFEAKFKDHTRFLKNSFFEGAVAAYSSGFDVVAMGVTEPVQFIADLEMKLFDRETSRQFEKNFRVFKFHMSEFTVD